MKSLEKKKETKKNKWMKWESWCLFGVAGLLPWIVRLYSYDTGLEEESWFPAADGVMADFFQFNKSRLFLVFAALMLLILLYKMTAKTRKEKQVAKEWILAAGYGITCLVSTICSVSLSDSLNGNYGRFETLFVLWGYIILCFFAFSQVKDSLQAEMVFKVLLIVSVLMILLGILQIWGKDPIGREAVQKLIIPKDQWKDYLGNLETIGNRNRVYLTLGNPNTASVYLAMVMILLTGLYCTGSKKRKRVIALVEAGLFLLLIFTYSRVGIVMLAAAVCLAFIFGRKSLHLQWKKWAAVLLAAVIFFFAADGLNQFYFSGRWMDTLRSFGKNQGNKLEAIETGKESIKITYNKETVYLTYEMGYEIEDGALKIFDNKGNDVSYKFSSETHSIDLPGWEDILFLTTEIDEEQFFTVYIEENPWNFTYVDDVGYMLYTGNGKYDQVKETDYVNLKGYERIASGRLYIWSRTVPLLKKYGLLGSGPDTFVRVFPQNDYVGKALYASSNLTVIEKPHNTFLLTAVQNGILAFLFLAGFIGVYLVKSTCIFAKNKMDSPDKIYGFVIFLMICAGIIGGLFNDSNLCTSPLFYLMLGMGIRLNERVRKGE